MRITSCDIFSNEAMRTGILRMGKASALVTWRDSSTTSLMAVARQVSTRPLANSSSLKALLW